MSLLTSQDWHWHSQKSAKRSSLQETPFRELELFPPSLLTPAVHFVYFVSLKVITGLRNQADDGSAQTANCTWICTLPKSCVRSFQGWGTLRMLKIINKKGEPQCLDLCGHSPYLAGPAKGERKEVDRKLFTSSKECSQLVSALGLKFTLWNRNSRDSYCHL